MKWFLLCFLTIIVNISGAQTRDTTQPKHLPDEFDLANRISYDCKWDNALYLKSASRFILKERWLSGMSEICLLFPKELPDEIAKINELLVDTTRVKINHQLKQGLPYIKFYTHQPDGLTYYIEFNAESVSGSKYSGRFVFECRGGRLLHSRIELVKSSH